jgi:hypothetical protein
MSCCKNRLRITCVGASTLCADCQTHRHLGVK